MPQFWLPVMFLADGIILCALSVPMMQGRVPRNGVYGFRTPRTLSRDAIWFPASKFAGAELFRAGFVVALGGLLLLLIGSRVPFETVIFGGMAVVLVPVLVAVTRCFRYLNSL